MREILSCKEILDVVEELTDISEIAKKLNVTNIMLLSADELEPQVQLDRKTFIDFCKTTAKKPELKVSQGIERRYYEANTYVCGVKFFAVLIGSEDYKALLEDCTESHDEPKI